MQSVARIALVLGTTALMKNARQTRSVYHMLKNKPEPNEPKYKVGDRIQISLNNKIVEATITAIVQRTDGLRLQVSYGRDLTALIYEWQVVKD